MENIDLELKDISNLRHIFAHPTAEEDFKALLGPGPKSIMIRFTIPAVRIPENKKAHMVEALQTNLANNGGEYGWEASIEGPEYITFYDFSVYGKIADLIGVIDALTGYAKH